MASFKAQYNELVKREGNYHSGTIGGRVDVGGETYRGIARKFNPNWEGWAYIDNLKKSTQLKYNQEIAAVNKLAYNYSKKQYWDKLSLDKVKSQDIADIIFEIYWGFPAKTFSTVKKAVGYTGSDVAGLVSKINTQDAKRLFSILVDSYASLLRNSSQYYKFAQGYENRILEWIKKRDNFIVGGIGFTTLSILGLGLFFF